MRLPRPSRETATNVAVLLFGVGMVLGGLLCQGCATFGSSTTPRVGQEQAVDVVWHQVFGRTDVAPLVRWREGSQLTCDDPESHKRGFLIAAAEDPGSDTGEGIVQCREGLTWSPLEVLVAWHGELSFSETALAHELEHAELLRRGIWRGHHDRPDFFTRIDAANAALIEAGR